MLKIRRPLGRLIFNMGIAIPGKTVFLIETAPSLRAYGFHNIHISTHDEMHSFKNLFLYPLDKCKGGTSLLQTTALTHLRLIIMHYLVSITCYWLPTAGTLTHCGLLMPYGDIDVPDDTKPLPEPMFDSSSVRFSENHPRVISWELLHQSLAKFRLKITYLKFYSLSPPVTQHWQDLLLNTEWDWKW